MEVLVVARGRELPTASEVSGELKSGDVLSVVLIIPGLLDVLCHSADDAIGAGASCFDRSTIFWLWCCHLLQLGGAFARGVHPGGVAGWIKVVQCGSPDCRITRGDEHARVADCVVGAIRFDLTPWLVPPIIQSITDDSGSDPLAFGLVLW